MVGLGVIEQIFKQSFAFIWVALNFFNGWSLIRRVVYVRNAEESTQQRILIPLPYVSHPPDSEIKSDSIFWSWKRDLQVHFLPSLKKWRYECECEFNLFVLSVLKELGLQSKNQLTFKESNCGSSEIKSNSWKFGTHEINFNSLIFMSHEPI